MRGRRRISEAEVEALIANPISADTDPDGNPRYLGEIRGRLFRVVVALDNPNLIITIHPKRKR